MTAIKNDKSYLEGTLWTITGSIDDYFRRLGGSGRYPGYMNWHVPAFILLTIYDNDKSNDISRLVCTLISSRIEEIIKKNCRNDLVRLSKITINNDQAVTYSLFILRYLRKAFDWQSEIDEWIEFLAKLNIKLPSDSLPEIVRYNGRRIKIIENIKDSKYFVDQNYPMTIIDKRIESDVGNARRSANGGYEGYIVCGNHELTVSGITLRDLAKSTYTQILVSEKY